MSEITKKTINLRPQARLDKVMAEAFAKFCEDNSRSSSSAIKLGLKQLIPQRYFEAARKKLNGRKATVV